MALCLLLQGARGSRKHSFYTLFIFNLMRCDAIVYSYRRIYTGGSGGVFGRYAGVGFKRGMVTLYAGGNISGSGVTSTVNVSQSAPGR